MSRSGISTAIAHGALVRRRRRGAARAALLTVLLSSLAMAACTAQVPEPPSPSATDDGVTEAGTPDVPEIVVDAADDDACALLPQDRLTEVLGGEEVEATAVPSGGWIAGQCSWSGPESAFILSVGTAESISSFEDAAEPDAEAKLAAYSERQADAAQEVADLGDAAVLGATGIAARADGAYLELEVLSLADGLTTEVMRLAVENVAG